MATSFEQSKRRHPVTIESMGDLIDLRWVRLSDGTQKLQKKTAAKVWYSDKSVRLDINWIDIPIVDISEALDTK